MITTISRDKHLPKVITKNVATGREIASFEFSTGLSYAGIEGLRKVTDVSQLEKGCYIVICGAVLIPVDKKDFPSIRRKPLK